MELECTPCCGDSFLNEGKDSIYNRIGYFIEEELVQD